MSTKAMPVQTLKVGNRQNIIIWIMPSSSACHEYDKDVSFHQSTWPPDDHCPASLSPGHTLHHKITTYQHTAAN